MLYVLLKPLELIFLSYSSRFKCNIRTNFNCCLVLLSYGFCDSLPQILNLFRLFLRCSCPELPATTIGLGTSSKVMAGALVFIAVINSVARFQSEVKSVHCANGSSMLTGGNLLVTQNIAQNAKDRIH